MNMLNSCLLEGRLRDCKKENGVYTLVIGTVQDGKSNCFFVKTQGQLAKFCEERYEYGRRIRVVGKLDQDEYRVFINAEHVDFDVTM